MQAVPGGGGGRRPSLELVVDVGLDVLASELLCHRRHPALLKERHEHPGDVQVAADGLGRPVPSAQRPLERRDESRQVTDLVADRTPAMGPLLDLDSDTLPVIRSHTVRRSPSAALSPPEEESHQTGW